MRDFNAGERSSFVSEGLSPKQKPPSKKKKVALFLLKWLFILGVWGGVFLGGVALWFGYDLPDIHKLELSQRRPSITVVTENEEVLATYGDLYGDTVRVQDLPPYVIHAFLAIEDRRFYSHFGVDPIGLIRAAWSNYRAGAVVQGGSTITQQLAKNFLFSEKKYGVNDRSFRRKIQEALLALWLEHTFTKDQILTLYLNRVYLGSGTYGLDAAARRYFGKKANTLSLYEAAVIAGLLKAPSKYSPMNNADLASGRALQVLQSMAEAGFITQDAKEAASSLASFAPEVEGGQSVRYFTDWVVDMVPQLVQETDQDLIITTTLDPRLQGLAELHVREMLQTVGEKWKSHQAALLSLTPNGAIRAMIGGRSYTGTKFNRVTQALRQPGSAFKFFIYLAALEKGFTPEMMMDDTPIRVGKWKPSNYLHKTRGLISFYESFARSVNSVAIRLTLDVGQDKVVEMARRLGITTPLAKDLTISLGSGEVTLLQLAGAFATIPNGGFLTSPYGIVKITNTKGDVLYAHPEGRGPRVLESRHVVYMHRLMEGVMQIGTGRSARISVPCAGKTGSNADRDVWLVAYTPDLVTAVWSGNDKGDFKTAKGGSPVTHLWKSYMEDASRGASARDFDLLVSSPFDALTEELPFEPTPQEQDGEYVPGFESPESESPETLNLQGLY